MKARRENRVRHQLQLTGYTESVYLLCLALNELIMCCIAGQVYVFTSHKPFVSRFQTSLIAHLGLCNYLKIFGILKFVFELHPNIKHSTLPFILFKRASLPVQSCVSSRVLLWCGFD